MTAIAKHAYLAVARQRWVDAALDIVRGMDSAAKEALDRRPESVEAAQGRVHVMGNVYEALAGYLERGDWSMAQEQIDLLLRDAAQARLKREVQVLEGLREMVVTLAADEPRS